MTLERHLGFVLAVLATLASAGLLWLLPARGPRRVSRFAPPPAEDVDLALACLGMGTVEPPVDQLSDDDLQTIVSVVARLVGAYARRDFSAFLALRERNLAFAETANLWRLPELRVQCLNLGAREEALPSDWWGLLGSYWQAYYSEAPVARFLPEATVIELHDRPLEVEEIETWEQEFRESCARHEGARLRHHLMAPHRRPLRAIARETGTLRWLDFTLRFEAHDAAPGWLVVRFVWDGREEEWFLHRATSVVDGELGDDRRDLVL
jgi:hypothetical protein